MGAQTRKWRKVVSGFRLQRRRESHIRFDHHVGCIAPDNNLIVMRLLPMPVPVIIIIMESTRKEAHVVI